MGVHVIDAYQTKINSRASEHTHRIFPETSGILPNECTDCHDVCPFFSLHSAASVYQITKISHYRHDDE